MSNAMDSRRDLLGDADLDLWSQPTQSRRGETNLERLEGRSRDLEGLEWHSCETECIGTA